MNQQICSV